MDNNIKIYDVITEATTLNSEGNTMQLQLFQRDSEQCDQESCDRELHGRLVLNTERLPESRQLSFGFMFADNADKSIYDGLQVDAPLNSEVMPSFAVRDLTSSERPNIFDEDTEIAND